MKRFVSVLIVSLFLALCLLPAFALADTVDLSTLSNEELLALWEAAGERLKAVGAYPYIALGKGDEGTDVTHLQQRLTELYFYSGDLTGKFDSNTQKAVKAFEKANQLESDGAMSIDEQQLLYSDAAQAKTTPTPSPSPTPAPTPVPDGKAFYITGGRLYEVYNYMRFQIKAVNKSKYTIDAFDIQLRAYNNFGEQLGYYDSWIKNNQGYTENDTNVKPGKIYKSGSYYWDLFGFDTATRIEIAINRYHTKDGTTVNIGDSDMVWVSIEKD